MTSKKGKLELIENNNERKASYIKRKKEFFKKMAPFVMLKCQPLSKDPTT